MRISSVTHTLRERVCGKPHGYRQTLVGKKDEIWPSSLLLNRLARGFVLGAFLYIISFAVPAVVAQTRLSKTNDGAGIAGTAKFEDNFDGGSTNLSTNWFAHPAYKIKVKTVGAKKLGQAVNTATGPENDFWNKFVALPKTITNPNIVKIVFGDNADPVGRVFTGFALMLDKPDTTADGYLLFHYNEGARNQLRLFKMTKAVPTEEIASVDVELTTADIGDTLGVEMTSDEAGHHFRVTINSKEVGIIDDPNKVRGKDPGKTYYAGFMINGNTSNGVDYFYSARTIDNVPPSTVTDLSVVTVSASSAILKWKAPGEDANQGTANKYDLRYSTSPINNENFAEATGVATAPKPAAPGTTQSTTVSGLNGGTTYYFALKTSDKAGNISALSNVVSATTITVNVVTDDFNRPGPGLGSAWKADADMKIVANAVQNASNADGFRLAIFDAVKNPTEVSMKWGPNTTPEGRKFSGLVVMASGGVNSNGYFIQYVDPDSSFLLWRVADGQIVLTGAVDDGPASGKRPTAGSVMKVEISSDAGGNNFQIYFNDQPARLLKDPNKLEGLGSPLYAGFMLDSKLGEENAIDEFSVAVPVGRPKRLDVFEGNNQIGSVEQPLPNPLAVLVSDSTGNPVPNAPISFEVGANSDAVVNSPPILDGNIRLEAELGKFNRPMEVRSDDNAGGGKYVIYPDGFEADAADTFHVDITQAGAYFMWVRSLKTGSLGNWDVIIDNNPAILYDVYHNNDIPGWNWELLSDRGAGSPSNPEINPVTFNWEAGKHKIIFRVRYSELGLDKIILTTDPAFVPAGKEELGFVSDKNGVARAVITLGKKAGAFTAQAKFGNLAPATFNFTATGGNAARLDKTSGDNQTGPAGQQLANPLVATVRDANNNAVANYAVDWVVIEGNGKLSAYRSVTGLDGKAQTFLTLGNQSPTNKVEARVNLSGTLPVFTATTISGLATSASIAGGNGQSATVRTALPNPLSVKVADGNGGGVANYPVEFIVTRGGGASSASNRVTNPGFENTIGNTAAPANWTLDGSPTLNEVQASTNSPKAGSRSLSVNANRNGVGVSQNISYLANVGYTLSFYAKVTGGAARVTWQMETEQVIDMTSASTKNNWQFYTIYANSPAAGNRALSFRTNGTGVFFIDDIKILPNTGSNGQLQFDWTMGDTAMTQQGQALILNGANHLAGSPLNFTATARAGAAAKMTKQSGDNQAGAANQPLPSPFVVKVADAGGINGVPNVSVTFQVLSGGGKLTGNVTTQTLTTKADGTAETTLTLGPQSGVTSKVKASAAGIARADTFSALAAIPNRIAKGPGTPPTTGSAGRKMVTPLVVRVFDVSNKIIAGYPVTFTVKEGGGTINGGTTAVIPTDMNGDAKAYPVLGTAIGARNRLEASVLHENKPVTNSPLSFVVRTVGLKSLSLVSGNNQSGVVSSPLTQPLKVKVADSLNAGIKDQNVIFTVTAANGKVNGLPGQGASTVTVKTDTGGVASVTWTLGPTPGVNNNKVQASTTPALSGSPVTFQASAETGVPKNLVKVTRDSSSSMVSSTMPLTVKVTDIGGNPKAEVNVTFTIKSGGGKVNNAATATIKSQANGQATVTLLLGPTAGAFINVIEVKALFNGANLTGSPMTYRITGTSSKAQALRSPSGNRQTGPAGEVLPKPLRIKVEDKEGNGVPNHPVIFKVIRGEGDFGNDRANITVPTDAGGFAQISWYLGPLTKPDSQLVEVSATDGVNKLQGVPFKFVAYGTPGLPSVQTSFVDASPLTLPADGTTRCNVTVYVYDRFGNPIQGVPVTIDVSGDGVKVTQPATPTDKNGAAKGSFTTTCAENKTVTARVISSPPLAISRGSTVRVTPLDANRLIQGGGNGQTGNINTALPNPLGVKVGDRYDNGVPSIEVKFKVERGDGKLYDLASGELFDSLRVRSDDDGLAKVMYICGAAVGENHIRISSGNLLNSPLLYLASVKNSPAAKIKMIDGSNGQQGTVGSFLVNPIGVKVTDSENRPVSGAPVKFSISLGGGLINDQTMAIVNSDAFGEAKVSWRLGSEAGLNVLRAEAPGLAGSPVDFEAQANPDQATHLHVTGQQVFGKVNALSDPLTVKIADPLGNGVQGVGVIFELIEGAGSLTNNYVVSGDGGFASTRVRFGPKSGPVKVRASAEGLNNSPAILTALAEPQNAVSMVAVTRSDKQNGTKGKLLNFPLQVLVRDNLSNPVPGVQVQFVVTDGGGNFNGSGFFNAVSDSLGIASAPWVLGANTGANTAKANKSGLVGSPITFTATAVANNLPLIADVPDVQAVEGDVVRFTINATDEDGDALTYQGRNLPSGSSFDALTRTFVWQTDLNSAGLYEPSFLARDSKGGADEEIVMIDVANRNQRPLVTRTVPFIRNGAVADTVIKNPGAGGSFIMRVFAQDPDGDILSYRWYRDGVFTGIFASSYEFNYSAVTQTTFSSVSVFVFDQHDTLLTRFSIKVPVELSSFSAAVVENQRVLLNWKTASEENNVGFNVLRSSVERGKYVKLNGKLIPPRRDGEYEFSDNKVEAGGKYYYKLESLDRDGQAQLHGPIQITMALPQRFELSQNYPNPFNPSTHIRFELPKAALISLAVFNSLGQEVRRLVNGQKPAGYHTVIWNGKDQNGRAVPSGVYHYRLQAGDFTATKKLVLAK